MLSLYNRNHYVGTLHKGKGVYVMVDPGQCEWVACDDAGRQLARWSATELAKDRILGLNVTYRG
jgi:hypothetical protein